MPLGTIENKQATLYSDWEQEKSKQNLFAHNEEQVKKINNSNSKEVNNNNNSIINEKVAQKSNSPKIKKGAFELSELRAYLPKKCFEKNLLLSLFYLFFDLAILAIGWYTYDFFTQSTLLFIAWEIVMGFFFWSLFIVGHDCGHSSFSEYPFINNTCGLIAHGLLFVPFSAWRHSHAEHHTYHNHFEKDRSHAWIVKHEGLLYNPKFDNNKNAETKKYTLEEQIKLPFFLNLFYGIFHFTAFHYYLIFSSFDFPHFWPAYKKNDLFSFISTLFALLIPGSIYFSVCNSLTHFFYKYIIPLMIFNSWLIIMTYLNHHKDGSRVFSNEAFNYVDGALESVDHDYGFLINFFCHNLPNCHIIHHLFFTQIPHYRLKEATQVFYKFCDERNIKYNRIKHLPYIGFFFFYLKLVLPYKFLQQTEDKNIFKLVLDK